MVYYCKQKKKLFTCINYIYQRKNFVKLKKKSGLKFIQPAYLLASFGLGESCWTGSIMAMVLDFWDDFRIRSMISFGRTSLIRWLGTGKNINKQLTMTSISTKFEIKEINFFSWNCIFGSFPSSKIDFWPILKLQKMKFVQRNYSWNWFIWFHKFFGLDFIKFSGPLWNSSSLYFSPRNWLTGKWFRFFHLQLPTI